MYELATWYMEKIAFGCSNDDNINTTLYLEYYY